MRTYALFLAQLLILVPTVLQEPARAPAAAAATPQPESSRVIAAAQQLIQQLVGGQFDKIEAQFGPAMAAALPAGKLATVWAGLSNQLGPLQSCGEATARKVRDFNVATLICKFQNAIVDAVISVDADGKLAGLNFRPHVAWTPPAYVKTDAFTEQPLIVVNGKFELPGTITIPRGDGPFPAVVLVHGSGPHDEDETVGANKPFKDLADGLASRGVAVLRYTKRTLKYGLQSSDDPIRLTVDDEAISDARAAVDLIAKQPRIDPARVFLVGHSLGAYLAPRIAKDDPRIAGIVVMAGTARPIEQVIVEQVRYLASSDGAPSEEGQKQIATAEQAAKQIESPDLKADDVVMVLGAKTYGAYWLDLRGYRPVETAATLKIPILILQGGRDYQVTPANYVDWTKTLSGRANVQMKLYKGLNHLFVTGTERSKPEEYNVPGHVAEDVVAEIASWVSSVGKSFK
jgi:dienelactone hydrolase